MSTIEPILVARAKSDAFLLSNMANRHGLIAGATGTGKTVTLQTLAENFSAIGVPVFMADVKGDLAGISQPGLTSPKIRERVTLLNLEDYTPAACPVTFWDVFGERGHPVRATISDLGPLLLAQCQVWTGSYATIFYILAGVVGLLAVAAWWVKLPEAEG